MNQVCPNWAAERLISVWLNGVAGVHNPPAESRDKLRTKRR